MIAVITLLGIAAAGLATAFFLGRDLQRGDYEEQVIKKQKKAMEAYEHERTAQADAPADLGGILDTIDRLRERGNH